MKSKKTDSCIYREIINGLRRKLYKAQCALNNCRGKKRKKTLECLISDLRGDIGCFLLKCGKYEKGLIMYETLSWKTHGEMKYHGIGRALMEMEYFSPARKLLNQGLKRFPESDSLLNLMGALHRRLGYDYEALQYFDRALIVNPESCDIAFNTACSLYSFNIYEEAALIFQKCIKKNPYEPYYFIMLGHCYLATGYPEEAVGYFKSALDIYDVADTYNGLYWAYEDMGLSNDAMQIAEEGLRKFPDEDSCLYYNLANAYHSRGWIDEARDIIQKGMKKFPDDEDLRELLKDIEDDSDDPKKGNTLPKLLAVLIQSMKYYKNKSKALKN
jgi:tetratricopeptide (TPR) repeat protein